MTLIANRYKVLEQLGAGGMGAVYLVYDKLRNQQVALKQVLMSDDEQHLAITREFRTLSTLRHPNIVGVIEYGFYDRQPYFTMDYVPNATPFASLGRQAIQGFIQMLQALTYLHRRGILHGDLKPANVLVTPEGIVKVLDFGLAYDNSKGKSSALVGVAGTLNYMSPEILNAEAPSIDSDLWAVGVMLCETLTGHHPFDTSSPIKLILSLVQQDPNLGDLSAEFKQILSRLLAKDPAQRYRNAQEVIQALSDALNAEVPAESSAQRESFLQSAIFVGRETEYQTLVNALNTIYDKKGQVYLIEAEAGAGKSRLLEELRTHALVKGFVVLHGQEVEGGGLPYQLWRDIARHLVLGELMPDLTASIFKELVPDIGTLLEREVPDLPVLESNAHRERLMSALLERLSTLDAPLLLLLEDLHWTISLGLLKLLLPHFEALPVLVVGSYRQDERPNLPNELPQAKILKLERLPLSAIAQLTASMLGSEMATPELVERLAQESEGNALFMVEVVRALAEDAGSLSNISSQTLPTRIFAGGIMAVLQRRLAKVPAWALNALHLSAIIGRKIDLRLLVQLGIRELDTWLQVCAEVFVLEPYQGDWRFSHDRLRESLLQELPELASLHKKVAIAIESSYINDIMYTEALVEHWHGANNHEKEVFYILKASEQMLLGADYVRAEKILKNALIYQLSDTVAELYFLLGMAVKSQGRFDLGLEFFQKGLEASPLPRLEATLLFVMGYWYLGQGNYAKALDYVEQSEKIAEKHGDTQNLAGNLRVRGWVARHQGNYAAARVYFEASLVFVRKLENQVSIGDSLGFLGVLASQQGDYDSARLYYEEALGLRRAIGDRWGIAMSLTNLAELYFFEGNYRLAKTTYLESVTLFYKMNNKETIIYALTGLIITESELKNYSAAHHYLVEVLRLVVESSLLPKMYVVLLGATYWIQDLERAGAWIGFLISQAGAEVNDDVRFKNRSKALQAILGDETFYHTLEHGKILDAKTEVEKLFKELTEG